MNHNAHSIMNSFKASIKKIFHILVFNFYKLKYSSQKGNLILVYSMGKVGSTSIYTELKKKLPFADIFHVHFLSEYWLRKKLPALDKYFHSNIDLGNEIINQINKNPYKRIKIITLVREPIIRDISDLFENWRSVYENIDQIDIQTLHKRIDESTHEYTLTWFDTEFKNYTGFNIYEMPFNKEKGYEIYRLENADILCLKLEALREVGSKAIKEFLGVSVEISNRNLSADKQGKNLYMEIKRNYKASESKLSVVYNSLYMKHFYTEQEIKELINKWS